MGPYEGVWRDVFQEEKLSSELVLEPREMDPWLIKRDAQPETRVRLTLAKLALLRSVGVIVSQPLLD